MFVGEIVFIVKGKIVTRQQSAMFSDTGESDSDITKMTWKERFKKSQMRLEEKLAMYRRNNAERQLLLDRVNTYNKEQQKEIEEVIGRDRIIFNVRTQGKLSKEHKRNMLLAKVGHEIENMIDHCLGRKEEHPFR